jgi:hypothetical protein
MTVYKVYVVFDWYIWCLSSEDSGLASLKIVPSSVMLWVFVSTKLSSPLCCHTDILYSFNMLIIKHSLKLWKCFRFLVMQFWSTLCCSVTVCTEIQLVHYFTYSTAVYMLLYIQYCSLYVTLHTVLQFICYFTYSTAVYMLLYIQYCSLCYFTYSTAVYMLLYIRYCSLCVTLHTVLQFIRHFTYSSAFSILCYFLYSNADCLSSFPLSSKFQAGIVPSQKGKETNIFRSFSMQCVCVRAHLCMYKCTALGVPNCRTFYDQKLQARDEVLQQKWRWWNFQKGNRFSLRSKELRTQISGGHFEQLAVYHTCSLHSLISTNQNW